MIYVTKDGYRIEVNEGKTGLYYATSPDFKGLLVAEPTLIGVLAAVPPRAIDDLKKARGELAVNRRDMFRMAGPALALTAVPMAAVAANPFIGKLVTREEILRALKTVSHQLLTGRGMQLRQEIMIDLIFEHDPEALRAKLEELREDNRYSIEYGKDFMSDAEYKAAMESV